jgi:ribonuclease HII
METQHALQVSGALRIVPCDMGAPMPKTRAANPAARVRKRKRAQLRRLDELLEYERKLWREGRLVVAGLDEAGAGPLAGPVVAACVVLDPDCVTELLGVDDSKRLSASARALLAEEIKSSARAFATGSASVEEIDRMNILQAGLLAMRRALDGVLAQLSPIDYLLVDARRVDAPIRQTAIIKGDAKSLSIAAASILAKVERDAVMTAAAIEYPSYGFEKHKGYGTGDHLAAVRTHGVTPLHRRTFEPISTMLNQLPLFPD